MKPKNLEKAVQKYGYPLLMLKLRRLRNINHDLASPNHFNREKRQLAYTQIARVAHQVWLDFGPYLWDGNIWSG